MLLETLGFFACLIILTLIGIGPALWGVEPGQRRWPYALAIAPTVGFSIIVVVGFPLVRFLAPIRIWGPGVTLLLIIGSLVIIWRDPKLRIELRSFVSTWPAWWAPALFIFACMVALVSPLALRGIQYAIFRTNSSDAFFYMSLADLINSTRWSTILSGSSLTWANREAVSLLAAASPTGLLAARTIGSPVTLGNMAGLGWSATITGLPVHRFYFAYNLLGLARVLPLAIVIGDHLGFSRPVKYLAAGAIALGFWARLVLEMDASAEVNMVSVLLLAAFAWIQLESKREHNVSKSIALFALALATIASSYAVMLSIVGLALAGYYGLAILQGVRTIRSAGVVVTSLAAGTIALLLPQLDYLARNWVFSATIVDVQKNFTPVVLALIRANGISTLWGLPDALLKQAGPGWLPGSVVQLSSNSLGLFLTAALIFTGIWILRRGAPPAQRIVLALLGGGVCIAAALLAIGNDRAVGKALTYVYPYFTLSVLVFLQYMDWLFKRPVQLAVTGIFGLWLAFQIAFGSYLPYRFSANFLQQQPKSENYDLAPITTYLDHHPPKLLLVAIPRGKDWSFAYYAMFAFGRYPAYFQTGLVVDNNTTYQNLWLADMSELPDYEVISKGADFLEPGGESFKVAETADLALYRLEMPTQAGLLAQQKRFQELDADKPIFPTFAH